MDELPKSDIEYFASNNAMLNEVQNSSCEDTIMDAECANGNL